MPLFSIEMNKNVNSYLNSFYFMGRFNELSFLYLVNTFLLVSIQSALDKNINTGYVQTTIGCIFYKYALCGMQYLETTNSVITCIMALADSGQPNGANLTYFIKLR